MEKVKARQEDRERIEKVVDENYPNVVRHFVEEFGGDVIDENRLLNMLKQTYFLQEAEVGAMLEKLEQEGVISKANRKGYRRVNEEVVLEEIEEGVEVGKEKPLAPQEDGKEPSWRGEYKSNFDVKERFAEMNMTELWIKEVS